MFWISKENYTIRSDIPKCVTNKILPPTWSHQQEVRWNTMTRIHFWTGYLLRLFNVMKIFIWLFHEEWKDKKRKVLLFLFFGGRKKNIWNFQRLMKYYIKVFASLSLFLSLVLHFSSWHYSPNFQFTFPFNLIVSEPEKAERQAETRPKWTGKKEEKSWKNLGIIRLDNFLFLCLELICLNFYEYFAFF